MRKRLEELNWRTQPRFPNTHSPANRDNGEAAAVFDPKPAEIVTRSPISMTAQQPKKTA
jgi:hypothetical protein